MTLEAVGPAVESAERAKPQITEYLIIPTIHEDYAWYGDNNSQISRHNAVTWNTVMPLLENKPPMRFVAEAGWTPDHFFKNASREKYHRLMALSEREQIEFSPAYIIQDERLAGELLRVLNHQIGRRILNDNYGINPSSIGLANDAFGFDSQTPQERQQLGLDNFIYTRGDMPEIEGVVQYRWTSPDGTSLRAIRQIGGYGNGDFIGREIPDSSYDIYIHPRPYARDIRIKKLEEELASFEQKYGEIYKQSNLTTAALYHGSDLLRPEQELPEIVEEFNRTHSDIQLRIGTHEDYLKLLKQVSFEELPEYAGELFGEGAGVLRGVDSMRIAEVKLNHARMIRDSFVSLALTAFAKNSMPDPRESLNDNLTRKLGLTSHDMLSGTVTDEVVVHEMLPEYASLRDQDARLQREAMGYLSSGFELRYNERVLHPLVETHYSLVNINQDDRPQIFYLPIHPSLIGTSSLRAVMGGREYPAQRLQETQDYAVVVATVPGYSAVDVEIQEAEESEKSSEMAVSTIENEAMTINATTRGIVLTDKKTGKDSLLSYRLFYDKGDSYRDDPLDDRPWMSEEDASNRTSIRIVEDGPLLQEIEVTQVSMHSEGIIHAGNRTTLSENKVPLTIKTNIRLSKGIERADISVTVTNPGIKDYQLQTVLATENPDKRVLTKENYLVSEKEAQAITTDSWFYPLEQHHYTNNLISAGDISLMGKGLHAFNAEQEGETTRLALTLLHGVEFLSQPDLYMGRAGYEHLVFSPGSNDRHLPSAQCLGTTTLEMAIAFGAKDKSINQLAREANDFSIGEVVGPMGVDLSHTLKINGGVVFGIKEAEDHDGLIYHIGNYGPTSEVVRFDRPVEKSFLSEERDSEYDEPLQEMVLRPYEFCAIRVK